MMSSDHVTLTMAAEGCRRLIQIRRKADASATRSRDEYGFIVKSEDLLPVQQLLKGNLALVLAPPWTGKTFVAKALFRMLSMVDSGDLAKTFGDRIHITPFEDFAMGEEYRPSWWQSWLGDSGAYACWIIDALDEGEFRSPGVSSSLCRCLSDLTPPQRTRLVIIIFGREAEVLPHVQSALIEAYGEELVVAELLPLDIESAREHLGDTRFRRATAMIKRHGLQSLAALPAVLTHIAALPDNGQKTDVSIWEGVLAELLESANPNSRRVFRIPVSQRFRVAQHIAAAMSFAGVNVLAARPAADSHTLDSLVPEQAQPGEPSREAGLEVLRSGMFRYGEKGACFVQRNVQDWLTALAIRAMPLSRIKPMLSLPDGRICPGMHGILRLLYKVSDRTEVREWLADHFGGIPPRSDAAPWGLSDSLRVLDRLEAIVSTSEREIGLWDDDGLKRLSAPGLGPVLATRLLDRKRSLPVRDLLFDLAVSTGSREAVPAAQAILRDLTDHESLRLDAAILIARVGSDADLSGTTDFMTSTTPKSARMRSAISHLMLELVDRGIWSLGEAAIHAPLHPETEANFSDVLAYRIDEALTLDGAKQAFARRALFRGRNRTERGYLARRSWRVDEKILKLVCEQSPPEDQELRKLISLALKSAGANWELALESILMKAICTAPWARRELYIRDTRRVRKQKAKGRRVHSLYRWILDPADATWLMSRYARLRGHEEDAFLDIYRLAYARGVAPRERNRIRRFLNDTDASRLSAADRGRRQSVRLERRMKRMRERTSDEDVAEEFSIGELVSGLLSNKTITPQQRMWQLSWICFSEPGNRPRNVTGQWADLSEETRQAVAHICRAAFGECTPTAIPDGNQFPSVVVYESDAFRFLILNGLFPSNADMLRKWLPSFIRGSFKATGEVLARCYDLSPTETTDAILACISRESLSATPNWIIAGSVQDYMWNDAFVLGIAGLVTSEAIDRKYRSDALRSLARHSEQTALRLAEGIAHSGIPSVGDPLWTAALNILVSQSNEASWVAAKRYIEGCGKSALAEIEAFHCRYGVLSATASGWPASRLGEMYRLIRKHYPPEDDPVIQPGGITSVTGDTLVRDTRGRIVWQLFERGGKDDVEELDALAGTWPDVRISVDHFRARAAVSDTLGVLVDRKPGTHAKPAMPPLKNVIRILLDDSYRMVRNDEDLLRVIAETLEGLQASVGHHLDLLVEPTEDRVSKQHRSEDALRTYLLCRLNDMLPGKILDPEARAKFERRRDIRVLAQRIGGGFATVTIEVKWQDNPEVATALVEQLGRKYLEEEGLACGIYLVGWAGGEKGRKQIGGRWVCGPKEFRNALEAQADEYLNSHSDKRIAVVVLDLSTPG